MGKNYKEKASYKFLHGMDDSVPESVRNKWDRKNFDVGRFRAKRKKIIEKDFDKMSKNDL